LKDFRERLRNIIKSMVGKVVTPGDVVSLTGLPRYEVLATFHVLEALGVVELVNEKGNYKVYKLSSLGLRLLEALESEKALELDIQGSEKVAEASA
jgi:alkylated DNA nucleotide flippase Atl1